jgi:hypothetical protein
MYMYIYSHIGMTICAGWELRRASPDMRRHPPPPTPIHPSQPTHHLFAFPLESNFSGARLDPALPQALARRQAPSNPSASPPTPQTPRSETPPRPSNAPGAEPFSGRPSAEGGGVQMRPSAEGREQGESGEGGEGEHGTRERSRGEGMRSLGEGAESGEGDWETSGEGGVDREWGVRMGPGDRWLVLLDAAKACCSSPPDLSRHPADFVVRHPLNKIGKCVHHL